MQTCLVGRCELDFQACRPCTAAACAYIPLLSACCSCVLASHSHIHKDDVFLTALSEALLPPHLAGNHGMMHTFTNFDPVPACLKTGSIGLNGLLTARQGRTGQGRAGQGRTGRGRAGQGRTGRGRAGQSFSSSPSLQFVFSTIYFKMSSRQNSSETWHHDAGIVFASQQGSMSEKSVQVTMALPSLFSWFLFVPLHQRLSVVILPEQVDVCQHPDDCCGHATFLHARDTCHCKFHYQDYWEVYIASTN